MYDGTGFKGWQTQDTDKVVRTVQEMIGKQLCTRYDTKITVVGASRTDLGVHARGQALHFDLPKECEDLKYLEFQMNRMLPDDVEYSMFRKHLEVQNIKCEMGKNGMQRNQQQQNYTFTAFAPTPMLIPCGNVTVLTCISIQIWSYWRNVLTFSSALMTSKGLLIKLHVIRESTKRWRKNSALLGQ